MRKWVCIWMMVCLLSGLISVTAVAEEQTATDLGDLTVTSVVLPVQFGAAGYGKLNAYFRAPDGASLTANADTYTVTVMDGTKVLSSGSGTVKASSTSGVFYAASDLVEPAFDAAAKTVSVQLTVTTSAGYYDAQATKTIPGTSADLGDLTVTSTVLPVHYGKRAYGKLNVYFRVPEDASVTAGTDVGMVTVKEGDTLIAEGNGVVRASSTTGVYYIAASLTDTTVDVAGKTVAVRLKVVKDGTVQYYDAASSHTIPVRNADAVEVEKEMAVVGIRPRYGIKDCFESSNLIGQSAVYRNGMDAYAANFYYDENGALPSITLAENFSTTGYTDARIVFTCAIGPNDTPIHTNPNLINLQLSTDGSTYTSSGVKFTAEATGDVVTYAGGSPTQYPVYRFTSGDIDLLTWGTLKDIKLVPCTQLASAEGIFRLLSLDIWCDSGEVIEVPKLGGNLNPTAEKTTVDGVTFYQLYDTDFSNFYSWRTNVGSVGQGTVNYKNASHPYTYLTLTERAVADGSNVRLYSPDMRLDTALYDSVLVEFAYFRRETDPAFAMKLGYSTDCGATWQYISANPTIVNVPEDGDGVKNIGATTRKATMDLKAALPADTVVTNVVILPYYNNRLYTLDGSGAKVYNTDYTSGGFRILEFSITGTSADSAVAAKAVPVYQDDYDSIVIQQMIDDAAAAGETEVIIPYFNPRNASNTWVISDTIRVPSGMTLYISDCVLVPQEYTYENLITNAAARTAGMTVADADTDLHIVGMGEAVIRGGTPNGLTSETVSNSGHSMLDNTLVLLHNVENFSVKNLRIEEARFWAVAMLYCSNGEVAYMDYYASRVVPEQDGVDVRNGCSNITIHDITGRTGDDSVGLNAINTYGLGVEGKSDDSYDVTVYNIFTRLVDLRMQVRVNVANGYKFHGVDISHVRDANIDFGGAWATASVRVGDNKYGTTNAGDIYDITISDVTAYSYAAVDTYDKNHVTIGAINSGCHAEYDAASVVNAAAGLTGPDGRIGQLLRYGTH